METIDPGSVGLSAVRLARIDAAMQGYVERGQVAGIVTLLARHGKLAHIGCYGRLDLASGAPMPVDALFRIYSMTKPVTALAVMMLFEEGRFQLMQPAADFLPELAGLEVLKDPSNLDGGRVPLERPITLFDLLMHTSGLAYGLDDSNAVNALFAREKLLRMDEPLSEKIMRVAQYPLVHQPGQGYTYSISYDLLGLLVERISGLRLDEFFQQRIFAPLGMDDTAFFAPPQKLARLAAMVTPGPDGKLLDMALLDPPIAPYFMSGAWIDKRVQPAFLSGGGGLVSSAADYLRFAQMLANRGTLDGTRLLSRKTVALMTAPHLSAALFAIPGANIGLGVTVVTDPARALIPCSPGAFGGGGAAHTDFWVDPDEGLVGVLMVQYAAFTPLAFSLDFKVLAAQAIDD